MIIRSAGVMLPLFSLPGPYGIGGFGSDAVAVAKLLKQAGFSYWLVLPFVQTGAADSPYQGFSSRAGNPYFINLAELHEQHLLTSEELESAHWDGDPHRIDYAWLHESRLNLLKRAFERLPALERLQLMTFIQEEGSWLKDYALFMSIKEQFDGEPWWDWPDDGLRMYDPEALEQFRDDHQEMILFYCYLQYVFAGQWKRLKEAINAEGIKIIGDMPIYVAGDSVDVWAGKHLFEVDEDGCFERVAGVPPDYFSEDGQLWEILSTVGMFIRTTVMHGLSDSVHISNGTM